MDTLKAKKLMIMYGQAPTADNFAQLLQEVDDHLVICIRVLRSKCPILVFEDPQDLYQCAIVGLSKACKVMTIEHDAERLDTRIFFYVKEAVYTTYLRIHREKHKLHKVAKLEKADVRPVWADLLFDDFEQTVRRLIKRGVISYRDYQMFVQHFAYKRTYKTLSKEFKLNPFTIRDHILQVLNILQILLQKEDYTI
jgi:hypothetical protein